MPREVSDEEYSYLRNRAQIADFIEPIYNDPQLGKEARAIIKKKYPQVQIPDYDIREEMEQRFASEKSERDETENKRKKAEQDQHIENTRSKVKKDYGFTDEGMANLEKFMVDRNVGDYEVAAEYQAVKNPRTSDAQHHDGFWHYNRQDKFAEISKDPEDWARNEILGALRRDEEKAKGWR